VTRTAAAYTDQTDSGSAGRHLGEQVREALAGDTPDAVIVFASARFDYKMLLTALQDTARPAVLVGASSAGEFTGSRRGEGTACALALRSDEIQVTAGLGRGVSTNRRDVARDVVASFRGTADRQYPYRAALILTDALAGHADDLVEQLTILTAGKYQFAGGGAGDDAQFSRTHVFFGTESHTDAVVALELLSTKPMGVGVGHGWVTASKPLRVTEVEGTRLISLNALPAVDAFEAHAESVGQRFDRETPLPFFLHNILGIDTGAGYRLRVPLAVNADGSITCAAEIPQGVRVHIMRTSSESAVHAATRAAEAALERLNGHAPGAALLFDCVATRLRMGEAFGQEVSAVAGLLEGAPFVGCNTYGQIARGDAQFGGFHNCTAVVMVLPA